MQARTNMSRKSNKREKLLDAATELIHQQGFKHTTLADIAEKSEVPLGNVYYYFKTKDDIASAVIDGRNVGLAKITEEWEKMYHDPRQRLLAFLDFVDTNKNSIVKNGCPIGGLCQELNKETSSLADLAGEILKFQIQWAESQFNQMGIVDYKGAAIEFISNLQGISLLANSLKAPDVVTDQIERLRQKISAI
jgi:AcrR family transcriptional regulator